MCIHSQSKFEPTTNNNNKTIVEPITIEDTRTRTAIHNPLKKLIACLQIENQNDGKQTHEFTSGMSRFRS
jgi:hypothetical protein